MSRDIFSLLKNGLKVTKPALASSPSSNLTSKTKIQETSIRLDDSVTKVITTSTTLLATGNFQSRWKITGSHLIANLPKVTTSAASSSTLKIAAFDLDGTLVDTESGSKFARNSSDWKWFNDSVLPKLEELHEQKYQIVIFTNQGGVVATGNPKSKSYTNFTGRVNQIQQICKNINLLVLASPKRPAAKSAVRSSEEDHSLMRKPNIGMWTELENWALKFNFKIDKLQSFFVGDAAGRTKDFLDSDKLFAENIGIKFLIPEEVFIEGSR